MLKGAREKMKKEQGAQKNEKSAGNCEKGARGKKLKGAGSKGGNCERSKEYAPSLTEAHKRKGLFLIIFCHN